MSGETMIQGRNTTSASPSAPALSQRPARSSPPDGKASRAYHASRAIGASNSTPTLKGNDSEKPCAIWPTATTPRTIWTAPRGCPGRRSLQ